MSEFDDALALLERAVARLEAAPLRADGEALARLTAERAEQERQTAAAATERAAQERQTAATAAEIVARVEAALAKIGQVLEGEG